MADEKKGKFMWVCSGRDDDKVAAFEWDKHHPDGEAYVAGMASRPVQVYLTPYMKKRMQEGQVVESSEEDALAYDEERHAARLEALAADMNLQMGGAISAAELQQALAVVRSQRTAAAPPVEPVAPVRPTAK